MLTRERWLACDHVGSPLAKIWEPEKKVCQLEWNNLQKGIKKKNISETSGEGIYTFRSWLRILSIQLRAVAKTCVHCRAHRRVVLSWLPCWMSFLNALGQFLPQSQHLEDKRTLIQKKYLDSASPSIQLERDQEQKDGSWGSALDFVNGWM